MSLQWVSCRFFSRLSGGAGREACLCSRRGATWGGGGRTCQMLVQRELLEWSLDSPVSYFYVHTFYGLVAQLLWASVRGGLKMWNYSKSSKYWVLEEWKVCWYYSQGNCFCLHSLFVCLSRITDNFCIALQSVLCSCTYKVCKGAGLSEGGCTKFEFKEREGVIVYSVCCQGLVM